MKTWQESTEELMNQCFEKYGFVVIAFLWEQKLNQVLPAGQMMFNHPLVVLGPATLEEWDEQHPGINPIYPHLYKLVAE